MTTRLLYFKYEGRGDDGLAAMQGDGEGAKSQPDEVDAMLQLCELRRLLLETQSPVTRPEGRRTVIAHQRRIRDERALRAGSENLFGEWWKGIDTSIGAATVRPVAYETAREIILEYEWLGTMPAIVWYSFGIFWSGYCGGVVCYSPEYGENLGVWDRYGYTGKILALSRGACAHWAHPHAGSKLIRRSMDLLPRVFEVITATVDPRAGEIGTVYQAAGFYYVGVMSDGGRASVRYPDGSLATGRGMRHRHGNQARVLATVPGVVIEQEPRKARYFAFRGSVKQRKTHLAAIRSRIRPYPKRNT